MALPLLAGTAAVQGAPAVGEEISHHAEAIHQEPRFSAAPQRIYEALLDARQFERIIQASGVMKELVQTSEPTTISAEEGGSFVLFGGHIYGRHIQLVPPRLIVQAWRVVSWPEGVYSMARFELHELGPGTQILFDHTGFPSGKAQHLAAGWEAHYWAPMRQVLG